MNNKRYQRLLELKDIIKEKKASKKEKKEYMMILYENGNISKGQYDKFNKGENSDNIVNAALTIGGIILASWLITKLFEK
jgi:hypothetical protein